MKLIKWKTLIITCLVCLLPIVLGIALWEKLPATIAIHFNLYFEPDGFASKGFAVFGLPFLMVVLQMFCCITNDISVSKNNKPQKLEAVAKWIIPILSIILYTTTLLYSIGVRI